MKDEDIQIIRVDARRIERAGKPEAIFAEGKSVKEVYYAIKELIEKNGKAIVTRINENHEKMFNSLLNLKVIVNKKGRIAAVFTKEEYLKWIEEKKSGLGVTILTAGTSDVPIAEEAAFTAEFLGMKVTRFYDVGVAGIHRLSKPLEHIRNSKDVAVIVVAGMEGALPSVVAGLVDKPVIGVPTSVGYGVNLKGLTPLFSMLLSCSSGVAVVNIDNGFGAAVFAYLIGSICKKVCTP